MKQKEHKTPYDILTDTFGADSHVVKLFLKFLIKNGIYISYNGRLSPEFINRRGVCTPSTIIIKSFPWYSFIPSALFFDRDIKRPWSDYHVLWNDICNQNNE